MTRFFIPVLWLASIFSVFSVQAQTRTLSFGVFSGVVSPFTLDEGIGQDPRYKARYNIRSAPIAINYGMDYDGFGFFISPGLINIGQKFDVVNTSGGHVGLRNIHQQYLNLPVAFKLHIVDLSFFKLSVVGGASFGLLLKGEETISHSETKLKFPPEVELPDGYTAVYDGVLVPKVDDYTMLGKSDFKPYQVFALFGFRSDADLSDAWRISFDFSANYGLIEPRSAAYMSQLNAHETLYDIPGRRRDLFLQLSVGLCRYIDLEKKTKEPRKQTKGSPHHSSKKYPWPSPRKRKPKG